MSRESSTQADEIKRQIGAQVDFYFADTNYRRDTYLRSLEQDGWVPIAQLLNFNKCVEAQQRLDALCSICIDVCCLSFSFSSFLAVRIKAITQDVDAIYSAVQGSHVVEVHPTEPKIKKKCFQISRDEADRRTVYVEGFPMNADHDSLRAEFSAVGDVSSKLKLGAISEQHALTFLIYSQVTLVSMPRHAKTRKFKGFAFVEFATVADASKACQAYSQGKLICQSCLLCRLPI